MGYRRGLLIFEMTFRSPKPYLSAQVKTARPVWFCPRKSVARIFVTTPSSELSVIPGVAAHSLHELQKVHLTSSQKLKAPATAV